MTTTVYAYPDEYSYPDQKITRTCITSVPFAGLALTSYDGGNHYSGSVSVQGATYTNDWNISPSSSTRSGDGIVKTFSPASGHTQGTFNIQIYAEINSGVLTFIFNPENTILQLEMSTTYTLGPPDSPGTPTTAKYAAPSADAYQVLSSYSTTQNSLVNIPRSTAPFQTTQTLSFSGQKIPSGSYIHSYEWTGTLSLSSTSQTSTPTPTANPTPTSTPTPTPTSSAPTPTTTEPTSQITAQPTVAPTTGLPMAGTASGSELQGEISIKRSGSNTWETVTGTFIAKTGDILHTGAHSRVTIQFSDGAKIHMGENSDLDIRDDPNSKTKDVTLIGGLIHLWEQFRSSADNRPFKVRAEPRTVSVRGSELIINANDTALSVMVIEGIADITNDQTNSLVTLQAGQTITATNDNPQDEIQQNVQTFSLTTVDHWWEQPTQNSPFTGSNLAIIGAAIAVVVVIAVLGVLLIRRKRNSVNANTSANYPPPPPPPYH